MKKAENLIFIQKSFVSEYKKSAQNYLDVLEDIFFAKKNQEIVFFGSATTPQIIMEDIQLIIDNADALMEEIEKRDECLKFRRCDASGKRSAQEKNSFRLSNDQIKTDLNRDAVLPKNFSIVAGPYLIETGCFGFNEDGSKKITEFYLIAPDSDPDKMMPKLAEESYFAVLEKFKGIDELSKRKYESGKRYDLQLESQTYRCTDLTYWPLLINKFLSRQNESNDLLYTLPIILKSIPNIDFLLKNSKIEKTPIPRNYLWSVHTAYSIFFLPYSKSVWRIEETPQYLLNKRINLPDFYISNTDLKKLGLDNGEFERIVEK